MQMTVICVLSLAVSACAGATSYGARPLEVRAAGNQILGCVSHDEGESVVVEDAGVSSLQVNGRRLPSPWGISFAEGPGMLSLEPGECLAVGQVPRGYARVGGEAELRDDWPYSFAIRLPEWGRFRTRNYSGVFCLRRTPHGLLVANVPKGPAGVTADVCRQRLDAVDTEVDPKSGVAEPRAAEPGGSRIGGKK